MLLFKYLKITKVRIRKKIREKKQKQKKKIIKQIKNCLNKFKKVYIKNCK